MNKEVTTEIQKTEKEIFELTKKLEKMRAENQVLG